MKIGKRIIIASSLILLTLSIATISSSCKCNRDKSEDNKPTAQNQQNNPQNDQQQNTPQNPSMDSTDTTTINFENLLGLTRELAGEWSDEEGKKGEKFGFKYLLTDKKVEEGVKITYLYYGKNVGWREKMHYKIREIIFQPQGPHPYYFLLGKDSMSGAVVFFRERVDYENFLNQVRAYGYTEVPSNDCYIPKTKTGKVIKQDFIKNEKDYICILTRVGLKNDWYQVILCLDI